MPATCPTSPLGRVAAAFYTFAAQRRTRVLLLFLLAWLLLCCALPLLRLNNDITAFFPDHTPGARALCRGVSASAAAQTINIDLYSATDDTDALIRTANSLRTRLAPLTRQDSPPLPLHDLAPAPFLALLPSLFDTAAQRRIEASIEPAALAAAARHSLAMLVGLPLGGMTDWLRHDPLHWRDVLLHRLPQATPHDTLGEYPACADITGGHHLLLRLTPDTPHLDAHAAVALMDACEEALSTLPADITATVASGLRHTAANTRAIDRDIAWIASLSLLGIVLVYALLVRSWGAAWLFATPLVAVSASLGLLSLSLASLSGLALGFGAAVLGIAEDYAVHSHFALRAQPDKVLALATLAPPLTQGLLLNASGFVMLLFSSLPALRQLAAFALLALCVGFALAVLLLPLLPGFDRPPLTTAPHAALSHPYRPRLPHGLSVCVAALALLAACIALLHGLPMEANPQHLGAEARAIMRDAQAVAHIWNVRQPALVLVEGDSPDTSLTANSRLLAELRSRWPEAHIQGSADLLPPSATARENCLRWQTFMREHAARITHMLTQAAQGMGIPPQVFAPFVETLTTIPEPVTPALLRQHGHTGTQALLAALLREFPQAEGQPAVFQSHITCDAPLDALPPEQLPGGFLLTPQSLQRTFEDAFAHERTYLPLTLALCALLLYCGFGNVRQSLLALLPPLASLAAILAGLSLLGTPLSMAHLAALPLVFGLAIDHGIMVTHDLAKGVPLGIERAVVVSSLTACTGMGLLAFAAHPALRALGQVIFLGLAMEVPTSLWLLPLFCREHS